MPRADDQGQTLGGIATETMESETSPGPPPCLVSGSASIELAADIAGRLGIQPLERRVEPFPDGETYVRLGHSVRGRDAYILQSTCPPVNEHLFELLLLLDTVRRANAARLTAVVPYYGYARQDRKAKGREPISAKLVANLIVAAGADRIVTVDLHSPAIQGFFDIGMDHLTAMPLLAEHVKARVPHDAVVVSPDTGGVKRADMFARLLALPIAILHTRRASASQVEIAAVIGDVRGKVPIIVDDIIATGGTILEAVEALVEAGARPEVRVVASHGVLAGDATRILNHPSIREVVVTDTVPVPLEKRRALPQLEVVSVGSLLAQAVGRLHSGHSLSALFSQDGLTPV